MQKLFKVKTYIYVTERATGKEYDTQCDFYSDRAINDHRYNVRVGETYVSQFNLFTRDGEGNHIKNINHPQISDWRIFSELVEEMGYLTCG